MSIWVGKKGGGTASDLTDLGDVSIVSPTTGQVLTYNATTQKWENKASTGGGGYTYMPGGWN
jgi:hypothetical protein